MSGNHILNFNDKKILFRVRTMACPSCEVGQAVHKDDAYQVYKTKKYAKPKRKMKPESIDSTSYYLSIEEALLSPTSLKKFKPPAEVESIFDKIISSNFFLYSVLALSGIFALTISIYLERKGYIDSWSRKKAPRPSLLFISFFIIVLLLIWLYEKPEKQSDE